MSITTTASRTTSAAGLDFTTDRATLVDALTTVGSAVRTRPNLPILGGVQIRAQDGHLTLSATDYDTTVSIRLPGTVHHSGALVVDHAELTKLVAALVKGTRKRDADALPVTIRTTVDNTAVVDLAGYTMPVTDYPTADYPTIPAAAPTVAQVDRETFTRELTRVMVAVSTDDALPMLTGINLEITPGRVTLVGTDRYRLAIAPLPAVSTTRATTHTSALVPASPVAQVAKRFTGDRVRIGLDDLADTSVVSLSCGPVTVTVHTLNSTFPNYRRLLPNMAAGTVRTDRDALLTATRRAAAVLDAKRHRGEPIIVTVTPNSVSVTPALTDHANTVTAPAHPATVTGITDVEQLWFTPTYLIDALNSFTDDTVTLHTQDSATRPVVLTSTPNGLTDDAAFRHLIMPIRPRR